MISAAAAVSSSSSPGVSLSFESSKPNGETFQTTKEQNKTKKIGHFSAHGSVRFYFIFSVFFCCHRFAVSKSVGHHFPFFPLCYYTVWAGKKVVDCFIYFPGKKKKVTGVPLCVHLICQFNVEIRVSAFCVVCVCTYTCG